MPDHQGDGEHKTSNYSRQNILNYLLIQNMTLTTSFSLTLCFNETSDQYL